MLKIQLKWVTSQNTVFEETGSIANIANLSANSQYRVQLGGRTGKHKVDNYPRWCEDPLGLVARAIQSGKPASRQVLDIDQINHVECSVGIIPGGWGTYTEISKCEWHREDETQGTLTHTAQYRHKPMEKKYALDRNSKDTWQLAKGMIIFALWNRRAKMPKALPLMVPEVQHGSLRVVRLEDIPEHVRERFAHRMMHSGRPLIPELGDVYYAWDWKRFLGH